MIYNFINYVILYLKFKIKGEEQMNPYTVLFINKKDELKIVKETWMFATKSTEEDYQELTSSVQEDNEKKEIILDKLIEAQYQNFYDNASKFVKGELPNDASLAQREQAIKERRDLLKECYDMICTREKRKEYEKMKESGAVEENKKIVPIISKEESIQKQIENFLNQGMKTRNAFSEEELKRLQNVNKSHMDSKNQFPKFSGALFNWGVMMNYEHLTNGACLLNEVNEKGEQVFVSSLGNFQFERLIQGPTMENPEGKYGKENFEGINVIGVTKSNSNGEVVRNDILVSRVNTAMSQEEKDFFKNVYFSDELIEQAIEQNEGFMGNVVKKNRHFEIQCNEFGDGDVISALRLANNEKGDFYCISQNQLWKKDKCTFEVMKERLKKFQLNYKKAFPIPAKINSQGEIVQKPQEEKGEKDSWAK